VIFEWSGARKVDITAYFENHWEEMRMTVNINYDTWFLKDEPWNHLLGIFGKERSNWYIRTDICSFAWVRRAWWCTPSPYFEKLLWPYQVYDSSLYIYSFITPQRKGICQYFKLNVINRWRELTGPDQARCFTSVFLWSAIRKNPVSVRGREQLHFRKKRSRYGRTLFCYEITP